MSTDPHETDRLQLPAPPAAYDDEPPTDQFAYVGYDELVPDAPAPSEIHPDDLDDAWLTPATSRGRTLRLPTVALSVLVAVAGGFWIGAVVEKHDGASASAASSLAGRFAAARGAGGFGGFGGAATGAAGTGGTGTGGAGAGAGATAPATEGLVTDVKGDVLYVTDTAGKTVEVTVGAAAKVTEAKAIPVGAVPIGATVVVQGSTTASGGVDATSVSATPAAG